MKTNPRHRTRSDRRGATRGAGATVGALVLLAALGCQDHRIAFDDFLQMERDRQAAALDAADAGKYPINPNDYLGRFVVGEGDVLTITVSGAEIENPMPPFQTRVDRDGTIDVPLAGKINVRHKTLEDVERAIQASYVDGYFPNVVVHAAVTETDTTDVMVVGAVTEPGLVPLRRHQRNMLFAIVGAGGASEVASGYATLKRIRKPVEELTFDLLDPSQLHEVLGLDPLQSGDIITVEAAPPNTIFVGGLVGVVGPQSYPPGTQISMLQAVAAAGGLRTDVFPREGTLVRRQRDGTDIHVKLDMNRLACGKDPNINLAPGDILWVPHTLDTRVEEWMTRNIFFRAGMTVTYNVTGREYLNRQRQQNRDFGTGANVVEGIVDPLGFLVPTTLP